MQSTWFLIEFNTFFCIYFISFHFIAHKVGRIGILRFLYCINVCSTCHVNSCIRNMFNRNISLARSGQYRKEGNGDNNAHDKYRHTNLEDIRVRISTNLGYTTNALNVSTDSNVLNTDTLTNA